MKIVSNVFQSEYFAFVTEAFSKVLSSDASFSYLNSPEYIVLPGFCDVHVHFREPGFFYKETIRRGSLAAAHGGYTHVCTMPNLNPVPDCRKNLSLQLSIINIDSVIGIKPYGAVTIGQKGEKLADLKAMASKVAAFSDDGHGVQDRELMRQAMMQAKSLNKVIAAHCEVDSLVNGGCVHKGAYALNHGLKGISSESEWKMIERDLNLAAQTGCAYHVCHISCKESVDLIRQAKKSGVDVTCETAPHYLVLDENDLQNEGRFKMNPPLRSSGDRIALIEGVADGTVDMIATDHAPHSMREKSKGLEGSAFGVVGLETAFPVLYTRLVKEKVITIEKLVELLSYNPRKRFNIPFDNSFTVWNMNVISPVNPDEFLSKGRATPFEGINVYGKCALTVYKSHISYRENGHYN
ncbi:MAG: dihydroorotase [Clostridiales bacterium]|nr:dihydroorotase [Clostridiales bacterium]